MEAILIPIFICFGLPVGIVFITRYYRYREKLLEYQARAGPKLLPASEEEQRHRQELEDRLQRLEAIVYSGEFELNQRLNRLPVKHLGQGQIGAGEAAAQPGPAKALPEGDDKER